MTTSTELHAAIAKMQLLIHEAADRIEENNNSLAESSSLNGIIKDLEVQAMVESDTLLVAQLRAAALPHLPNVAETSPEFPKQSSNLVACKGEILSPILWQGRQWAVTEYGIEARDGSYTIGAGDHFWGSHGQWATDLGIGVDECWLKHMRQKTWIDIHDFSNAVAAFKLLFDRDGNRMLDAMLAAGPPPAPVQDPVYLVEDDFGLFRITTKADWSFYNVTVPGAKKTLIANAPQPVPVQKPVACVHKKYSIDTATGKGNCLTCKAEGEMRFIVNTLTPAQHDIEERP